MANNETITDEELRKIAEKSLRPRPGGKGSKAPYPPPKSPPLPALEPGGTVGVVQEEEAPPPKFGWTPPKDPDAVVTTHASSPSRQSPPKSEIDAAVEAFLKKVNWSGDTGMIDLPTSTGKEYQTAVEDSLANSLEHRYKNLSEGEGLEGAALEQAIYDASAEDFESMGKEQARWDDYEGSGYTLYQMEDSKGESRMFLDTPNGLLSTDVASPVGGLVPEISEERDEARQRIADRLNQMLQSSGESGKNYEGTWDTTGLE